MEFTVQSIDELPALAQQLIEWASARRKLAFHGEIGAGKTTFIQTICQHLGATDKVTSPTFSLVNEYYSPRLGDGQKGIIHHMDLYRLKNEEEALGIGIEDYLYDESYCLIEWPEVIEDLLPPDTVKIYIQILDDSVRKIIFL
ncbi:MAG: tRNA (adenosine(37)-N6)-threonylcarbamoyltransferase complex ATPase subunit type 1 TsaE [Bacteroidota bacterium]